MSTTVNVTVQPAIEPVTLAEVKTHLRIDFTDDDGLIQYLITAARTFVEQGINRALITQTLRAAFELPMTREALGAISGLIGPEPRLAFDLPFAAPGVNATVSTVELETDVATWTVLSTSPQTYALDTDNTPARLWLKASALYLWLPQWDWIGFTDPRVRVTYTAGYGSTEASVPALIRQSILQVVGHLYENRESAGAIPTNLLPAPYVVYSL